jgi:polyhydroxybutyrate depolymerase
VYVPAGVDEPRVVVVVLHGGGGEGLGVAEVGEHPLSVFRSIADRERFVVVYPEGLPANDRQGLIGWVDCRADNTTSSGADDIGFLAALVESVGAAYELPPSNMFMAGGSNGAQMTQAFAFHHPEMLGAVASSSGSLPLAPLSGPCTDGPAQPIPILLVHGTADTQMPYNGGCVADLGGACNRGRAISAEATRDRWLAINGLSSAKPVETTVELVATDGGAAHRFAYAGSTAVEWWRLDGAGHTGASRTVLIEPNRVTGTQNRDIEFAEVAWSFFVQRLPPG